MESTSSNLKIEPLNENDLENAIKIIEDYKKEGKERKEFAFKLCASILDKIDYKIGMVNPKYCKNFESNIYYCIPIK